MLHWKFHFSYGFLYLGVRHLCCVGMGSIIASQFLSPFARHIYHPFGVAEELLGFIVLRNIFLQLFDDGFGGAKVAGGVLIVQQEPVLDGGHRVA